MGRIEARVKTEGDMQVTIINAFSGGETIKKIDARSYQGGYKVIIKTIPKEENKDEAIQDTNSEAEGTAN